MARSRPIFEKVALGFLCLSRLPEPDHREETLRSRRLLLLTVPSFFVFLQIGPVSAFLWNSQNHRNRCPLLLSVPSFCSCLQLGRVSAFFFNLEKYRNRRPLLLSVPSFCSRLQLGRVSAFLGIPQNYRKRCLLLLSVLSFCSFNESGVSPFSFRCTQKLYIILVFGDFRPVAIYFGGAIDTFLNDFN